MFTKDTFDFLKELKENNNKEWFEANRKRYETAKKEHLDFVTEMIPAIAKWDKPIAGVEPKKCVFRINRDIRFSKDKSPYKSNMGAHFSPPSGSKEVMLAGYYFHLEPGHSMVAGGMWEPFPPQLKAIRQEIDFNLKEFESILNNKEFKKHYPTLGGDKLKTKPKGYELENPAIEYLKHTSFVVSQKFTDKEVMAKDFPEKCAEAFKALYAFDSFLNRAIGIEVK